MLLRVLLGKFEMELETTHLSFRLIPIIREKRKRNYVYIRMLINIDNFLIIM